MTFGQRFKELRLEKGLKQQELVDDFNNTYGYNFNKSSISQYENDKRKPEIDVLKDFALYFNVSLDYLLGISENRNSVTNIKNYISKEDILKYAKNLFIDISISRSEKDMFFKNISELYFESLNVK